MDETTENSSIGNTDNNSLDVIATDVFTEVSCVSTRSDCRLNSTPLLPGLPHTTRRANKRSYTEKSGDAQTVKMNAKTEILLFYEEWEDDFQALDVQNLSLSILQDELPKAEELRNKFRRAMARLGDEDKPYFDEHKDKFEAAKKGIVTFVNCAKKKISELSLTSIRDISPARSTVSSTAQSFKCTHVEDNEEQIKSKLDKIKNALIEISGKKIENDMEFHKYEENLNNEIRRAQACVKESNELIKDALEVNKEATASSIDKKLTALKITIDDSHEICSKLKRDLGLSGGATGRSMNLEVPKFDGKSENMDVFTFKNRFNEYIGLVKMSVASTLSLLKNDCMVTADLKKSVARFKNTEECLNFLIEQYGNVTELLQSKKKEILKIGSFPWYGKGGAPSTMKQRDWLIKLEAKLFEIIEMVGVHEIENQLYYGDTLQNIMRLLPESVKDKFVQQVAEQGLNTGQNIADGKDMFGQFVLFITGLRENYTLKCSLIPSVEDATKSAKTNFSYEQGDEYYEDEVEVNYAVQKSGKKITNRRAHFGYTPPQVRDCPMNGCDEKHTHIFYCKKFQQIKDFKKRLQTTTTLKVCFRCLRLDSDVDFKDRKEWYAAHEINCITEFWCIGPICKDHPPTKQKHMLVCGFHYKENKTREQEFIDSLDNNYWKPEMRVFTMVYNSSIQKYLSDVKKINEASIDDNIEEEIAVFMLHTITVKNKQLLVFYDTGCGGSAISKEACNTIGTTTIREGPTWLGVAGGKVIPIEGGDERYELPLHDKKERAKMIGLEMKDITVPFPVWEYKKAWDDVIKYHSISGYDQELPKPPKSVGGRAVDILIGIKYYKYHPKELFILPCGLGVFKSRIECTDGNQAVLGGPHAAWSRLEELSEGMTPMMFFTSEMKAFYFQEKSLKNPIYFESQEENDDEEFVIDIEVERETDKIEEICCEEGINNYFTFSAIKTEMKDYESQNDIGAECDYRCPKCRKCGECKNGEMIESKSLQEEIEDLMIKEGIRYDNEEKVVKTRLPFIKNPEEALSPNQHIARKVFNTQKKLIDKNPEMRDDIIMAFNKLNDNDFVCRVDDLDEETKALIMNGKNVTYTIPWRIRYKESKSTPCRLVYDGSSRTPNNHSLNEILASGSNRLANLFKILLSFRSKIHALTGDIATAYNGIKLEKDYYRYQLFLWQDGLIDLNPVEVWVIKTLIYGVKCSGNITIEGIAALSDCIVEKHPDVSDGAKALKEDSYMDDILTGGKTVKDIDKIEKDIGFILGEGSMNVKCFTRNGMKPSEKISADGQSIGMLGYLWYSENDEFGLDQKPIFLEKSKRGKHSGAVEDDFESHLKAVFTKRTLCRIVASVFDPLGMLIPITSGLRRDLREIMLLKTDWDEDLPIDYLPKWTHNLERIKSIKDVKFKRWIVPEDASELKVDLIVSVDASKDTAVASVHAKVPLRGGGYSIQLLTAKSKLVTTSTIPKAELKAARIGATLGHLAKMSLKEMWNKSLFVTDSQIVLFWISQDTRPLSTLVRNCVIDIRRFTNPDDWKHIQGTMNIADLPTRYVNNIKEVDMESKWQKGQDWMYLEEEMMPIKSLKQVKLSEEEAREAANEIKNKNNDAHVVNEAQNDDNDKKDDGEKTDESNENGGNEKDANQDDDDNDKDEDDDDYDDQNQPDEYLMAKRYELSKYIPDPCSLSWPKVIRVRAAIIRFVENLKKSKKGEITVKGNKDPRTVRFTEDELKEAENYFWRKTTKEVKKFCPKKTWEKFTVESDGILYYKSRIVQGAVIDDQEGIFQDLEPLNFVRPVVDVHSPVAYSILKFSHIQLAKHRNATASLNESRKEAFILNGLSLSKKIYDDCPCCKKFNAKVLDVEMGKVHESRFVVAPPFFTAQCDIMGPFDAHCEHNHRSVVKCYGLVFKCPATHAISVHVMQTYSTESFLCAFTRFSTRFGYPKKLHVDAGSQLVKGCKEMKIEFQDLESAIYQKSQTGIDHEIGPVGGHNYQGDVERSIKEVKKLFKKTFQGQKLDLLNYETAFQSISSDLNSMPISWGTNSRGYDNLDLITPARLIFGRNNLRSPIGHADTGESNPGRILKQQRSVREAWWETWKSEAVGTYVPGNSKWTKNSREAKKDDVVIFLKRGQEEKIGGNVWRVGLIDEIKMSEDGFSRQAVIKYKLATESVFRRTTRSLRTVAVLVRVDEPSMEEKVRKAREMAENM